MARYDRVTKARYERARKVSRGEALNDSTLRDASAAVLELISNGGYLPLTRDEFAERMQWRRGDGAPDRDRVERALNLTRDQNLWPDAEKKLAGMMAAYGSVLGGVVLVEPTGLPTRDGLLSALRAMAQIDQGVRTRRRRMLATAHTAAEGAESEGDFALYRVLVAVAADLEKTGFFSDETSRMLERLAGSIA